MALEALSVYALNRPESPFSKMTVHFHVPGKSQTETLATDDTGLAVETDLKVTQRHIQHRVLGIIHHVKITLLLGNPAVFHLRRSCSFSPLFSAISPETGRT